MDELKEKISEKLAVLHDFIANENLKFDEIRKNQQEAWDVFVKIYGIGVCDKEKTMD